MCSTILSDGADQQKIVTTFVHQKYFSFIVTPTEFLMTYSQFCIVTKLLDGDKIPLYISEYVSQAVNENFAKDSLAIK